MNRRRALSASVMSGNAGPIDINNYLTIVALEDGLTAKLSVNTCEYCVDGDGDWKSLLANTNTASINKGQTLSFRGNLTPSGNGIGRFTISKSCNLEGNCMSMLFGDDAAYITELTGQVFNGLFYNCTVIRGVSSGFLPATTVGQFCYYAMFYGCSNLTTAPELPAENLINECYSYMFYGCTKLNYIKAMFITTPSSTYTKNWVKGVASTGKFIKNGKATWNVTATSSNYYIGIPSGWSIQSAAQ